MTTDTTLSLQPRRLKPPRILIFGPHKIGKSSFGAMADRPVFIQTEDGLSNIDVPAYPLSKSRRESNSSTRALVWESRWGGIRIQCYKKPGFALLESSFEMGVRPPVWCHGLSDHAPSSSSPKRTAAIHGARDSAFSDVICLPHVCLSGRRCAQGSRLHARGLQPVRG